MDIAEAMTAASTVESFRIELSNWPTRLVARMRFHGELSHGYLP